MDTHTNIRAHPPPTHTQTSTQVHTPRTRACMQTDTKLPRQANRRWRAVLFHDYRTLVCAGSGKGQHGERRSEQEKDGGDVSQTLLSAPHSSPKPFVFKGCRGRDVCHSHYTLQRAAGIRPPRQHHLTSLHSNMQHFSDRNKPVGRSYGKRTAVN